jgi:hypothetical protein
MKLDNTNPCTVAAKRLLAEVGIRDYLIVPGGKHPQLRFSINGGNVVHVFSLSGTPSDWRSAENTKRDLKKLLRNIGVIAPESKPQPQAPKRKLKRADELERQLSKLKSEMEQQLTDFEHRLSLLEGRSATGIAQINGVNHHEA